MQLSTAIFARTDCWPWATPQSPKHSGLFELHFITVNNTKKRVGPRKPLILLLLHGAICAIGRPAGRRASNVPEIIYRLL